MSKTNTEKMAPETQTPEMANGMKLDVRVRPIAPMGNLLAFANVTIGGCFKIDGFRICSSEKGLYVNMPATQDKGGTGKMSAGRLRQSSASSSTMLSLMGTARLLKICRRLLKRQRELRKNLP